MGHPTDAGSHGSVAGRYGMIRPHDDRQIAGVCAGIGRATGTDPLLWRVLLAVGVLFGGVGLVAYLLGWLLMPEEDDTGSPLEALFGRGRSSTSPGVAVLLAGATALLLTLTVRWTPFALAALTVAGYLLYRQRRSVSPAAAPAPVPPAGGDPTETTVTLPVPAPEPGRSPTHQGGPLTLEPASRQEEEIDLLALAERYRNGDHLVETTDPAPGAAVPDWQPPSAGDGEESAPPRRKTSPALTRGAFFAALIALGVVAVIDLAGGRLGFSAYVAAALAVTGAALVVGAWRGRPPWLIGAGTLLSVLLAISTAVESADLGVPGDQILRPTSVDQIRNAYTIGFGNATLDLRQVDFTGQHITVDVRVNAGNFSVLLPPDVDLTGQARVQFGNAHLTGKQIGGPDLDRPFSDLGVDGEPGPGEIRLHVTVNAGNLEVRR